MLKKYWKKTKEFFGKVIPEREVQEELALPLKDETRQYLPLPQEVSSLYGITRAHRREEDEEELEYPILEPYRDRAVRDILLARDLLQAAKEKDPSLQEFAFRQEDIVFEGYRDHYLYQRDRGIYRTRWVPASHVVEKVYTSMGNLSRNPFQLIFYFRTLHGFEDNQYCKQMVSGRIFYNRSGEIQAMELLQETKEQSQYLHAKYAEGQFHSVEIKHGETAHA